MEPWKQQLPPEGLRLSGRRLARRNPWQHDALPVSPAKETEHLIGKLTACARPKNIPALGCGTVSAPVEQGLDPAQATFRPSQL